jgi:hypothetical protein
VQGRRGAEQSDLCAESVRARAGVEGVCVRMRARGETLWSGRLTLATAGRAVDSTAICSSTFYLSGELIPTESKKISAIGEKAWQAVHLFMTRSLYAR